MSASEKIRIMKLDDKSDYGFLRILIKALCSVKGYDHFLSYELDKTAKDSDTFTEQQKVSLEIMSSAFYDSPLRFVYSVVSSTK